MGIGITNKYMSLNIGIVENVDLKPKIIVLGVGGAGGNAVNNMIQSNLDGVEFWVANTDAQALSNSLVPEERRIQLGIQSTRGLGAGSHPEIGARAAEESLSEIQDLLESANMCFITAGMGGGTGTGAAPIIAKLARDMGILTVGVVTKPFHFEGARRMRMAESGLSAMQEHVDTLIIIPNQNLFRIANEKTTFAEAFSMADEVLHSGVRSITDLITYPGIVNLDFADIKTIMVESGKAMMGTGEADGESRAVQAAENAISNPLLDISSMKGAQGVLINISGGYDMTLYELDEAANRIKEEVDGDANIIVGSAFNESLEGKLRVSVVATGIDQEVGSIFDNSKTELDRVTATSNTSVTSAQSAAQKVEGMALDHDANSDVGQQRSMEFEGDAVTDAKCTLQTEPSGVKETEGEKPVANTTDPFANKFNKINDVESSRAANFESVDSLNNESKEEAGNDQSNKKHDIFDIPAFLRRKIGKK